jgi:hypothetical protein
MPDPRIECGAGKSGMTRLKELIYQSSLFSIIMFVLSGFSD